MVRKAPALIMIAHNAVDRHSGPQDLDVLAEVKVFKDYCRIVKRPCIVCPVRNLRELKAALRQHKPSLVVNMVEMLDGSERTIHKAAALYAEMRIPFTGCSAAAIRSTGNKRTAKALMRRHGIPTAALFPAKHDGAWIVKSLTEHASFGMDDGCVIYGPAKVKNAITARRKQYGGQWFAEAFIEGREFNIAVLNGKVLPIAEIDFSNLPRHKPKIVGFAAKWHTGSAEDRGTVRRFINIKKERKLAARLAKITLQCWRTFGLSGYARVDFRVDCKGRIFVLEVNTNPGIAPDAGFMAASRRDGLLPHQVADRIVKAVATGK